MIYAFGDYALDTDRFELRRLARPVEMEPQVLQLLAYLIAQRHRVVPKNELIEHIWPQHYVSDNALHQRIATARRVLGDSTHQPTCIRTIRGRGYHFIAPVTEGASQRTRQTPAPQRSSSPTFVVAREPELAVMQQCWESACDGDRQMVWVTGEAGIGKTALVNALIERIGSERTARLGRGQCVDQYGPGEAYMPILEALEMLGRDDERAELAACLSRYAPSWIVQLPSLVTDDVREHLQRQAAETTPQRMLRELLQALEQLTLDEPVVLVLEDLHWSDPSTLALLAALARRTESARLLIVATYRPTEARRHRSELEVLTDELRLHGKCRVLALATLDEEAVHEYFAARFRGLVGLTDVTRVAYERTEGHPLFLVTLANSWIEQGWLQELSGGWRLQTGDRDLAKDIPLSLQHMIRHQVDRLEPDDQELLAAASVIGHVFSPATVAACRDTDLLVEEAACKALEQRSSFIDRQDEQAWPDGTVSSRYGFSHAIYRDVISAHTPAALRLAWHRQVAARLERAYQPNLGEVAAQLAMHCEQGRLYGDALVHHQRAAQHALTRKGLQEARSHLTRGLELLDLLPPTPEHVRHEFDIQIKLGPISMALEGFSAPDVERAYTRARELCDQLGEAEQLFPVLWGLWASHQQLAAFTTARALGDELLDLAHRAQDPSLLLQAHHASWTTLYTIGELAAAKRHMEYGIRFYDKEQHHADSHSYGGHDAGVCCRAHGAPALQLLGYPDQAIALLRDALLLSEALDHPFTTVAALHYAMVLYQFRGEAASVQEQADAVLQLAKQQGFQQRLAQARILRGWALTAQGDGATGVEQIRHGLAAYQGTRAKRELPYYFALMAEAYARQGHVEAGLRWLAKAIDSIDASGERLWAAEVYRLRGELLILQSPDNRGESESCFQRALEVSRQQQARSLELRAAASLARLWQSHGSREQAQALLEPVYSWFAEGMETADLVDARELLDELE